MSKVTPIYNSFTSGEFSPRLDGRTDIKLYNSACKTLENFFVWVHGGAAKRPGTRYISTVKDISKTTRLIPYVYSEDVSYVLEFGDEYIRFYTDGGQVQVSGVAYEISSPFTAEQVGDLKFAQNADVMYFVHPYIHPQKLIRYGDADWTIEDIPFTNGPFLDENIESTYYLTPSATTGNISITASGHAPFVSTHVGSFWKFRGTVKESRSISAQNLFTNTIEAEANNSIIVDITGTWSGQITLQRSTDNGANWLDLYYYTSNISTTTTEYEDDVLYRIGIKTGDYTSGTAVVAVGILDQYGYVEITTYVDQQTVSGTVRKTLPVTAGVATTRWSEGAWSDALGYPSVVTFFEERLVFGATGYQIQNLWFSQLDDYENFESGVSSSDALTVMLASNNVDIIQWFVPTQSILHVGTLGSEWKVETTTTTPYIKATSQTSFGSSNTQAVPVGEIILFIQKGGRKLRQRYYHYEPETWVADEIGLMSEHLLQDGITYMAYADDPDPIVWMVRTDGKLVGVSFDLRRQVVAFHEHETDGSFESIAVIPGTDRDELWAVVKRTTQSGTYTRFVEQFQSTSWEGLENGWYLDSAIPYDGVATTTVSGLGHLEGLEVIPTVSGAVLPAETVVSGIITLDDPYPKMIVGLPYTATLQTMSLDVGSDFGTAQSKKKKVHNVNIRFFRTLGAKVGSSEDDLDIIPFRSSADLMGSPPALFTGDKTIEFPRGADNYITVYIVSDQPTPMHILAIMPEVATFDY
jgi:hypothetical protein